MHYKDVEGLFPEEKQLVSIGKTGCNMNYVYHYSNIDAIINILKTKRIRLSHISNLNDTSEGEYVFCELRKRISLSEKVELLDKIYNLTKKNSYVASFSKFGNMLSQWRSYGGICLGFDRSRLVDRHPRTIVGQNGVSDYTAALMFPECEYLDRSGLAKYVDSLEWKFQDLNPSMESPEFQHFGLTLGSLIYNIKHAGFHEEMEFRIAHYFFDIIPFTNEKGKKYIEFVFNPDHIKRIVLGPSPQQEENLEKFADFLNNHDKYSHIDIYRSTIPFVAS
jgi:hypothetical protein